jgi:hypothetical protein
MKPRPIQPAASLVLALLASVLWPASRAGAEITVKRCPEGAEVKIDGELFARYLTDAKGTPAVWPIIGPTGKPMTRAYPMAEDNPEERKDHPHHRSLWFTHGSVNGLSFWHRETIKHREFVKLEGGERGVIVTRNDWVDGQGRPVCEDERALAFGTDGKARWIDFDITLKALDKPVTFGDTKEGTFGVRVAGSMKVDAKQGGHIVNSLGQTDQEAWGKNCQWVDYHGPVDGKTVGIAIFNHPSSFRFPTYWHVRTYGLFAANPFGLHDFEGNRKVDGSATIKPGETMTLRYRVFLHLGDEEEGEVARAYAAYAKEER